MYYFEYFWEHSLPALREPRTNSQYHNWTLRELPSQTYSPPDAKLCNIMQHYVIRGDISPHFHRLIVVNDRFCGDNLIDI